MSAHDSSFYRAPITHESLEVENTSMWVSRPSDSKFPIVAGIPVLFPDARLALSEIKLRAQALLGFYESNVETLKQELKMGGVTALTQDRLEKTRQIQIHHLEFLRDLLTPLKLSVRPTTPPPDFGYRLPPSQALQGYFPNLVRDWSSAHGENEKHFELVREAAISAPLGKVLVVGSGAGRLAYDVHQHLAPSETICADLNIILTLASNRITDGETLKVVEFTVAPKNIESAPGVVRDCRAPSKVRAGFSYVMADAYYLPFESGSIDTVITPWLVDILPHRLEFIVSEINRVLKPDGRWINSGSFNFRFANWRDCLSIEEGLESIKSNGFIQELVRQDRVPYLQSDLDAHQRSELVTTFVMKKSSEAKQPLKAPLRPAWILDSQLAVPVPASAPQQFATLESQAFVISLIDGKRSALEIASMVSQRYGLPAQDARDAVVSFISRLEDDSIFRSSLLA
jgi:ubiquinone/menaquinone biosynthesis C-methylase UbiE